MKIIIKCLSSVLLILVLCTPDATANEEELIAHWNFDEGGRGKVLRDSSGSANHGNIHGAQWIKLSEGYALQFDGVDDYVDCGSGANLHLKKQVTVSAWIYPKADSSSETVIVGEGPPRWGITHYRGRVWFYVFSGSNHCNAPVPLHQWTHVAGTFDGQTMKLYVNGRFSGQRKLPAATSIMQGTAMVVGGGWNGRFFNGMIKDLKIHKRVLLEEEIMAMTGIKPQTKPLINAREREAATQFFQKHAEPVASKRVGKQLWLANGEVGIEFVQEKGRLALTRFYGVEADEDFLSLANESSQSKLWELVLRRDKGLDKSSLNITSDAAAKVSSEVERDPTGITLRLKWAGLDTPDEPGTLDVEVTVSLKKGDTLSRWRIKVTNRSKTYGLWFVKFPTFSLKPIGDEAEKNFLSIPWGRGIVLADPFTALQNSDKLAGGVNGSWGEYPAYPRVMQFQSLYHESGNGLYLALHDGEGYRKFFGFIPQPTLGAMEYEAVHCPANMGYPAEDYQMTYDMCLGPFKGDWYDAAQIYRKWALQQRWCSKGPLISREDVPRWYKESPALLVTSSRRGEQMVDLSRQRMLDALSYFDTELPLVWYGWKKYIPEMTDYQKEGSPWQVPQKRSRPPENIHDGNYPALPAQSNFSSAAKDISEAGGHVLCYVCASIFDPGLNENSPLAAQAKPSIVINEDGKVQLAEGGKVAWTMCSYTPWWQQRLADTVSALVRNENAKGIYLDTFYGGRVTWSPCFNTAHGHSHGGGNDSYLAARKMLQGIRAAMKEADPEAVIAGGESAAETAIDVLDSILYVQGNIESGSVPMFATVYGDYLCRYGRSARPWREGNYVDSAAMFSEGGQMGRLTIFENDLQDYPQAMSFMRKLAAYWKPQAGLRFLAYGQLLRPITFQQPEILPTVDFVATWAAQDAEPFQVPTLQNGVFRAADGSLGIFIVNVSDQTIPVSFDLTPDRYPILQSKTYRLAQVSASGQREELGDQDGKIVFAGEVVGRDLIFLEVTAVAP